MAEAATTLLDSDRASIFLWDKPNKTLVARPALGVPGGELRIPEGMSHEQLEAMGRRLGGLKTVISAAEARDLLSPKPKRPFCSPK